MSQTRNLFAPGILITALCLAPPGLASAASVGHYELCSGQGETYLANAITAGGNTPVNITVPDATQLSAVGVLLVTNCDNGGFDAEWTSNLAAITARVQGGMDVIFFDRAVTGANAALPGGAGLVPVRDFSDGTNVDLPATSPLLNTNGGPLTQTSLDGGNWSTHGYVTAASLPAGGVIWAHRTSTIEGVIIRYPHGSGSVVYSTIPGDYYLSGSGSELIAAAITSTVDKTVDIVGFTTCAASGIPSYQLPLCRSICESRTSGGALSGLITLWRAAYKTNPPCL